MITDSEFSQILGEAITAIWEKEIKEDYINGWLLKEDTLKNALYYHLRSRLGTLLDENDIRIFTEYNEGEFKCSGYRPDMIIARVDMDKNVSRWADAVTEYLAVIELKYKMGFAANKDISADYEKLQDYVETLGVGCKLYMATIWECEDDATAWIEDAEWNQGKVTELNASYVLDSDGIPQFYVVKH